MLFRSSLVGTDSHTTMVNGLAVLGWGVGGIEAEAAMLGQPLSMLAPEVIGFRLSGAPKEGVTATDVVLTVTQMLRKKGVVGKFVEFFGDGLAHLTLADRATIANMAPEYGATCGFFPIDSETLSYLHMSGRSADRIALVEAYAKAQGMLREASSADPAFTDTIELDLATVAPSLAGPKRPEGRVTLEAVSDQGLLGTLTIAFDSRDGLLVDALRKRDIDSFRVSGRRVSEVSRLAIAPEHRSKDLLASMFHAAYVHLRPIHRAQDLFIEVNPRHAAFYKRMMGFRQLGDVHTCPRVGAPAGSTPAARSVTRSAQASVSLSAVGAGPPSPRSSRIAPRRDRWLSGSR